MLSIIMNTKISDEKIRIGLIKILLLDSPEAQSIINSLSLLSLFRTNNVETNKAIGTVSWKILGKSKSTYEK